MVIPLGYTLYLKGWVGEQSQQRMCRIFETLYEFLLGVRGSTKVAGKRVIQAGSLAAITCMHGCLAFERMRPVQENIFLGHRRICETQN
jgi:hypothetical protein